MKKLRIPSALTALAYNSIKQYILEGRLDENTKLTESMLSSQLGISRSPVREALNSLATEGLIRIESRRGAFLRRFSPKEISDLYELRQLLEVYAVQTAEITPKLLVDLLESVQRTRSLLKENKKQEFMEEDMRFHGLIAMASGNQSLCTVLENVQHQIWLCRCKTYNLSSSTAPSAHQGITDALRHGDRRKAQAAMGEHITYVRRQLIDLIGATSSSGPSNETGPGIARPASNLNLIQAKPHSTHKNKRQTA
jgi:DNA-binding GntR family transcriptional regulator